MVQEFDIDSALHLQCYLLHNASYYLDMYLDQQGLHKEASWLFKVWSNLLLDERGKLNRPSHVSNLWDHFLISCQIKNTSC